MTTFIVSFYFLFLLFLLCSRPRYSKEFYNSWNHHVTILHAVYTELYCIYSVLLKGPRSKERPHSHLHPRIVRTRRGAGVAARVRINVATCTAAMYFISSFFSYLKRSFSLPCDFAMVDLLLI